jgi:predicted DNA-binding transcriptional regulator AlpA
VISDDDVDDPLFLKPHQMARLFGVSLRTLWRWRSGKLIPEPVKSGNVVRWRRAEVLQWVADRCPGLDESDNGGRRR